MILLSFDIEEFDMPFEYGRDIPFSDQISISRKGTIAILDLLQEFSIHATFFCTVVFAKEIPDLIDRIVREGHELASHGYYHSNFEVKHLLESRKALEALSGVTISGYRMARMMPVDEHEVFLAGYHYNSSINPTWLPGRYNNLSQPRTFFRKDGVVQLPASVSPDFRFPLFWLSFHNLPLWLYIHLAFRTLKADGYLNIYFHPWEFTDLNDRERFNFPAYVRKNTGNLMTERFRRFIRKCKAAGYQFSSIREFLSLKNV